MPRPIDGDALRDKVLGWFHRDPQDADGLDDMAASVIMEIDAAPTVSTVQWIPAAERLPDGPGPYLYTSARGLVGMGTPSYIAGQSRIESVIAWAELPEPYKEDKPDE